MDDKDYVKRLRISDISDSGFETEADQIVSGFSDLVTLLYPNADSPISVADVKLSVKKLVAENKELRKHAVMYLHSLRDKTDSKTYATAEVVVPTPPNKGSRTFHGQWSDHWKIGARIDHRKQGTFFEWLPGKITYVNQANHYRTEDEYDVQLNNGDTVLGVSRNNLRTSKQGEKDDHVLDVILVGSALLCCFVLHKCYTFGTH